MNAGPRLVESAAPAFDPIEDILKDLAAGKMVVIGNGDLATAMRASMAIPGAFAPVATDQYILSDGGLVRNIPVDVARDLCADVVIVVNLVEPTVKRERLQTVQFESRMARIVCTRCSWSASIVWILAKSWASGVCDGPFGWPC